MERAEKRQLTGMELARGYYEAYGRPMLRAQFPSWEHRIAVGLVGEGSECFGFDDDFSRDHDFGPAFCMWLEREDAEAIGAKLQKAYESLPDSWGGLKVRRDSAMTGHRTGVWEIGSFYSRFLSVPGVPQTDMQWLQLPESYLAVAVNGAVFRDDLGTFTGIRKQLAAGYPEDVRIKKIVARAAVMAQAGQYNYPRCAARKEPVAAELALAEFMKSGMSMIYLLNRRYAPFYKWMHRGLGTLPRLAETGELFARLTEPQLSWQEKTDVIEAVCRTVVAELGRQQLTDSGEAFLQVHLEQMTEHIKSEELRRLHWLAG